MNSRLDKRVAAAFPVANKKMTHPDGYFNSYGSCSRHIEFSFFPSWENIFLQLGK